MLGTAGISTSRYSTNPQVTGPREEGGPRVPQSEPSGPRGRRRAAGAYGQVVGRMTGGRGHLRAPCRACLRRGIGGLRNPHHHVREPDRPARVLRGRARAEFRPHPARSGQIRLTTDNHCHRLRLVGRPARPAGAVAARVTRGGHLLLPVQDRGGAVARRGASVRPGRGDRTEAAVLRASSQAAVLQPDPRRSARGHRAGRRARRSVVAQRPAGVA
jgi:hypothetical protein